MSKKQSAKGIWTAMVTPFLADGSIDWASFEQLLQKQVDAGVKGLVIAGTTAESPALTVQEKLSLIKRTRACVGHKVRLMAGSGSSNTQQSVELSIAALEAGADCLLIVTPPYNKPSLAGLLGHYGQIAKATHVDLCLYHVPGRTAQSLVLEDFLQLIQIPNITSIKEASGNLALFSAVTARCDVDVLSGDDPTFLSSLAMGGAGAVSVVTNLFPKAFVRMQEAFLAGNVQKALRYHRILQPLLDILFCESNPAPLKAAMSMQGLCQQTLRLPLAPVSQENYQKIKTILEQTTARFVKEEINV